MTKMLENVSMVIKIRVEIFMVIILHTRVVAGNCQNDEGVKVMVVRE